MSWIGRGTKDNGWLRLIVCNCGAVGVVLVVFWESSYVLGVIDSFVLYSFIWSSKSNLLVDVEKIPRNPA